MSYSRYSEPTSESISDPEYGAKSSESTCDEETCGVASVEGGDEGDEAIGRRGEGVERLVKRLRRRWKMVRRKSKMRESRYRGVKAGLESVNCCFC